MSMPEKVKAYLAAKGVNYEELAHKTVYTAFDAASTLKKGLNEIAKSLLVQADKTFALVVVPADKKIDLAKLKKVLGVKKVSIPDEKIMVKILKIKPGSLSSFGKLHQLEVWVDKAMAKTKKAVFSTGSFTDSVLMKVKDFVQNEEAKLADIAMKGGYKIPVKVKKQMKKVKAAVKSKKVMKKTVKKGGQKTGRADKVKKVTKRPAKAVVKKSAKKRR